MPKKSYEKLAKELQDRLEKRPNYCKDRRSRTIVIDPDEISQTVMDELQAGLDQDFDKIGLTPLVSDRALRDCDRRTKIEKYLFNRLAVKKQLLELHEPILSYSFVEVIDPPSIIDTTLIEELDAGTLEGGLTDALFYECLEESLDYLAYEPFRQRLREWQAILNDPLASEEDRSQAKKKLMKVGKVLAKEPRGRPSKHQDWAFVLGAELNEIARRLEPFLKETQNLIFKRKKELFEERFPDLKEYAGLVRKHREAREIAKEIIIKKRGFSKRTLHHLLNPK